MTELPPPPIPDAARDRSRSHSSQKRVFSTSRSRSARRREKLAREARQAAADERKARDEKYRQARELSASQNNATPEGGGLSTPPSGRINNGVDDRTRIALFHELSLLLERTQRFEQFTEERLWNGAFCLAKYRILTLDILRRTNAQARKYFFDDIREKDGLAFDEIIFLVALFSTFSLMNKKLPLGRRMSASPWRIFRRR